MSRVVEGQPVDGNGIGVEPAATASSPSPEAGLDLAAPRARLWLALILLAGGLVRLGVWAWFAGTPLQVWDERDYNTLAVNIVRNHEFAFTPGRSISLRPPLYPA